MDEAKHSPLPWAVKPRECDDWGIIRNANNDFVSATNWSSGFLRKALKNGRTAATDPAQPNADFIVLACNAYYSDQATIAAQATRIVWLERPVTEDEVRMAYSSIAQSHLIGVRAFPDALAAALEFRMRAAK